MRFVRHRESQRDLDDEGAADARPALRGDLAPHQIHDAAHDGKAQARAAKASRGAHVRLREGLEDAFKPIRSDADAGVVHFDPQPQALGIGHASNPDADTPPLGELDRIAEQVRQDLTQAHGISAHATRYARLHLQRDAQSFRARALGEQRHDILNHVVQVEVERLELELVRLDLREVQDLVDDFQQCVAGSVDGLHAVALRIGEIRLQQQVGHAQHAIHGRADLVTHVGEEHAL